VSFSRQRLVQDCVDGFKKVSLDLVEMLGASLGYLDEVINEDISGSQGPVERPVGRGRRLYREHLYPRERLENGVSFGFVSGSWAWFPGYLVVVLGCSFFVKLMRRSDGVRANSLVGEVTYGFGHDTEGGLRLDPSHEAGEWDGNELRLPFKLGKDHGEAQTVQGLEEELVEAILEVLLVALWRAKFWVDMSDQPE
jgi:hypothetical protein